MRKALSVGRKEVRQILRDRRSLTLLLFAQGLSTATAYFATLIGATPASRGGQA